MHGAAAAWLAEFGPGSLAKPVGVLHGYARVEQDDWLWPRRGDWMARLDDVLLQQARPVVLVACCEA